MDGYFVGAMRGRASRQHISIDFECLVDVWRNFWVFGFVWAGGFRMIGHPESLLWHDRFQVTISVVEYCSR